MEYYDLHVDIENIEGAINMAKKIGFNGIALTTQILEKKPEINIDLVSCIMIKARNKDELKKEIEKNRERFEILMVYGGEYEINRAACEDSKVDLLCHPEKNRNDSGLDHVCVKAAAENNVAIEINFNEVLNARNRPKILSFLQRNIFLCKKYNTKVVTTSGAKSIWEIRAPRELAALTYLLGHDLKSAIDSISIIPKDIVDINREKLSGLRFGNVRVVKENR